MKIDINRLKLDANYWDAVAPKDCVSAYVRSGKVIMWGYSDDTGSWTGDIILRPSNRNQDWQGVGFPPVGCTCEFYALGDWRKAEIIAYVKSNGLVEVIAQMENEWCFSENPDHFRAIRTQEERLRGDLIAALKEFENKRQICWREELVNFIFSHYKSEPEND